MGPSGHTALTWLGRLLIVLAVVVLVGGLVSTDTIQVLNPVVCPDGTELVRRSEVQAAADDDTPGFDVLCASDTRRIDANGRLLTVVAVLLGGAAVAFVVRHRVTPRRIAPPNVSSSR